MTTTRRRLVLGGLFAAHLAAGSVSAANVDRAWPHPSVIAFLALFLSEANLIGLWAGFSSHRWAGRVALAAAGSGYLFLLPALTAHGYQGEGLMFASLATLSLLPGFLTALAMRWFPPHWRLRIPAPADEHQQQLQVSMRFLFAFTAVIGLLLAMLQWIGRSITRADAIAALVLPLTLGWICCIIAIAAFVPRRAVLSACAAAAVCSLIGVIPAHYMGAATANARPPVPWIVMAGADAAIITASLLVVRGCGYRLVPQEEETLRGGNVRTGPAVG